MGLIPRETIDKVIEATDLVKLISSNNVPLKKRGANSVGNCPFHSEKTGSFTVSNTKNFYKCFGCGESGNAIAFLMKHNNLQFVEAVKELASEAGIEVEEKELTVQEQQAYDMKNQIYFANDLAMKFYHKQLLEKRNETLYKYALERMDMETIQIQSIGIATSGLKKYLNDVGVDQEVRIASGLTYKSKEGAEIDTFQQLLLFPIRNHSGRIAGFTGRSLNANYSKYKNTAETPVFQKRKLLYGLNFATKEIGKTGVCYIVEGNIDVLTLSRIGLGNVVACSGTALSVEQINLLKRFGAKTINLMYDSDPAGVVAMKKNAKILVENQLEVKLVLLPQEMGVVEKDGKVLNTEGGEFIAENGDQPMTERIKHDPDEFFKNKSLEEFRAYEKENIKEYVTYFTQSELFTTELTASDKASKIKELVELIACYPREVADVYMSNLSGMIKPAKALNDAYKKAIARREQQDEKRKIKTGESEQIKKEKYLFDDKEEREFLSTVIPDGVDLDFYKEFGFYQWNNQYFFELKKMFFNKSNFVLEPIAHIRSGANSRRVYSINNKYNYKSIVDLKQADMVSINSFKAAVESQGNYLFTGDGVILDKLKEYLYKKTILCFEINQLGWQSNDNFFAYGNGITINGEFNKVNEYGIVKAKEKYFYLPAFSVLNKEDEMSFTDQRSFIHKERDFKPSLLDISNNLISLYGDNAKVVLCAYLGVIFKDVIRRSSVKFPIINVFGVRGSGKTEFCQCFMSFFGQGLKERKLDNTTISALATYIGSVSNAFVHLDEYKNNIGKSKIELLKQIWDETGRNKTNLDDLSKTISSRVDCGAMLSGQELCTADNALLSRTCTMFFFKDVFTDEEVKQYYDFKELIKPGLTHITNDLLSHRAEFEERFPSALKQALDDLKMQVNEVETRLLNNWAVLLGSFLAIKDIVDVGMDYKDLVSIFGKMLIDQHKITNSTSEIFVFWDTVITNLNNGNLRNGYDMKIKKISSVTTNKGKVDFDNPTNVLFISMSRTFNLYKKTAKEGDESTLNKSSLISYLENTAAYLGSQSACRFKKDAYEGNICRVEESVTSAMVFKYDLLGISLPERIDENKEEPYIELKKEDQSLFNDEPFPN